MSNDIPVQTLPEQAGGEWLGESTPAMSAEEDE
jgi:hypothetical protein